MYNRITRRLSCSDSTDSWTQTNDGVFEEARGQSADGTSRVALIIGIEEDIVNFINVISGYLTLVYLTAGIGIDSSTVTSGYSNPQTFNFNQIFPCTSIYKGFTGIGYHTIRRLTLANTGCTWYGDAGNSAVLSGMMGEIKG